MTGPNHNRQVSSQFNVMKVKVVLSQNINEILAAVDTIALYLADTNNFGSIETVLTVTCSCDHVDRPKNRLEEKLSSVAGDVVKKVVQVTDGVG